MIIVNQQIRLTQINRISVTGKFSGFFFFFLNAFHENKRVGNSTF